MSEPSEEGYAGPATLLVDSEPRTVEPSVVEPSVVELSVEVTLRGVFQPIDGRYHWYGRLTHDADLVGAVAAGAQVLLRTPHGEAPGRLTDIDPWGRFRVDGTGRPPFTLARFGA